MDAVGDLRNAQIEVWSYRAGGWVASTVETAGVARPNFWVHVVRFPGAELVPSIGSELGWVYDVAGLKNIPDDVVEQDCRGDVNEGKAIRVVLWPKVCSCLAFTFDRPQADRLCAQGSEGPLVFVVTAGSNDTVCLGQCGPFRATICEGADADVESIIGALSADAEMEVWNHPFGRWLSRSLWTTLPVRRHGQTILVKTSSTALVVGLGAELEAQDSSRAYLEELEVSDRVLTRYMRTLTFNRTTALGTSMPTTRPLDGAFRLHRCAINTSIDRNVAHASAGCPRAA